MAGATVDTDLVMVTVIGARKESKQVKIFEASFYDKNGNQTANEVIELVFQLAVLAQSQWQDCPPYTNDEKFYDAFMQIAGH